MIPRSHPLASVGDAFNAVFVEAEAAGQLMFYGRGRRGRADRQRGARRPGGGRPQPARRRPRAGESAYADLPVQPMGEVLTRYHVGLDVADQPGVLAAVAGAFAEHEVSIATVRQGPANGGPAGRGGTPNW